MAAELRVIEGGAPEVLIEEHGIKVLKENKTGFYAKAWRGRAKRPYAYYHFKTEEARDEWVETELKRAAVRAKAKAVKAAEDKVKKAESRAKIVVGTVLCNEWGYDQTNVDFYEVVRRSATGATVWVKEIALKSVGGSGGSSMSDSVVPVPGEHSGDEIKKVVGAYGVQFTHGWTSIVENVETPHYRSWYA